MEVIKDGLRAVAEVLLIGFGNFKKQQRKGRNPQTGAEMDMKVKY